MKTWAKRILYVFIFLLLAFGLLFLLFYKRFVVTAPQKEYPEAKNLEEAQYQDLDYLSLFPKKDRSFDSPRKTEAFFQYIDSFRTLVPMENHQFTMGVARAMAQARNTHTNVNPSIISKRLNAIPLRFYWFGDDLHVAMATRVHKDLLGVKVRAINGHSPLTLIKGLKPWYGGSVHRLKFFSPLYFMSPEILDATGYGFTKDSIQLTYETTSGVLEERNFAAFDEGKDIPGYWPPSWLDTSATHKQKGWHTLTISGSNPLPYSNTNAPVTHSFIQNGLYVHLKRNSNSQDVKINAYLAKVLNEARSKTLKFAILDLRFNPGGDYHMGRSFIKGIQKILDGKPFYIITGNGTFSAGVMTAAFAKKTAGDNAIILGEPVGDTLHFWADGGSVMRLPNSKIPLRIWTAYHDWQNGCTDWSKCFWITIFDGVEVDHLNPDKTVSLRFDDYLNGEDTVLNVILALEGK